LAVKTIVMQMEIQPEKWQTDDIGAFEAFYRQYDRLVFKSAFLMVGSREEAEDILQEVFLSAWQSRRTYDAARGKITTWLHAITMNKCFRSHRKAKAPAISTEDVELAAAADCQPEEILVTKDEYSQLLKALNGMDKKHRAVIILRFFHDLDYKEIAGVLHIPIGTVKSRLNNALSGLRLEMRLRDEETG
jgi:RNA polymerase sigma-70 factor, ECF subfamily